MGPRASTDSACGQFTRRAGTTACAIVDKGCLLELQVIAAVPAATGLRDRRIGKSAPVLQPCDSSPRLGISLWRSFPAGYGSKDDLRALPQNQVLTIRLRASRPPMTMITPASKVASQAEPRNVGTPAVVNSW